MAFVRDNRFGLEYNAQNPRDGSSGKRGVVLLVSLGTLVLIGVSLIARWRMSSGEGSPAPVAPVSASIGPSAPAEPLPGGPIVKVSTENVRTRPAKVQSLLSRLEEAERKGDLEMAISTIEQLRNLPGEMVADLDNALARRLGVLNVRRLFVLQNRQWVKDVAVKAGDSATRIATAHGSTLSSLVKLNGARDVNRLQIGQTLKVMDHPRFTLVVHRATKIADLSLNGKFFKRYDLTEAVHAAAGNYETPARLNDFLAAQGISLAAEDRAELTTLLPVKTPVLVSEL